MKQLGLIILILFQSQAFSTTPIAVNSAETLPVKDPFQTLIDKHYHAYQQSEFFSGIQVSIQAADDIKTYTTGFRSHEKKVKVTDSDLFQIGSITKSFTAALTLLAEEEGVIELNQPLRKYLSAYPNWQNIKISQLLNMTSGLPNYSDAPMINIGFAKNIKRYWNRAELIDLVYIKDYIVPLRIGYDYTNTGYILIDMILTKDGQKSFGQLMQQRIITPLQLSNTFYPVPNTNGEVNQRLVSGYAFNVYSNPELVGHNIQHNNLSWAAAAGGIVANSKDVVKWVDALFLKETLLNKTQKSKMQSLVSIKNGQPIDDVSASDPRGFGLGIIKAYDKAIGKYWYYEGETLGFRALYMVVPCNQVIIATLFNSATNHDNDHSGELMVALYRQVLKEHPQLKRCQPLAKTV